MLQTLLLFSSFEATDVVSSTGLIFGWKLGKTSKVVGVSLVTVNL